MTKYNTFNTLYLILFCSIGLLQAQSLEIEMPDSLTINISEGCMSNQFSLPVIGHEGVLCNGSLLYWSLDYINDDGDLRNVASSQNPEFLNGEINDKYIAPTLTGGHPSIIVPNGIEPGANYYSVTLTDECSNELIDTISLIFKDALPPSPYCSGNNIVYVYPGAELKAIDFNQGSYDNCTSYENLRFTFTDVPPPSRCDSYNESEFWYDGSFWFYNSETTQLNPCSDNEEGAFMTPKTYYEKSTVHRWNPEERTSVASYRSLDLFSEATGISLLKIYVWDENNNVANCNIDLYQYSHTSFSEPYFSHLPKDDTPLAIRYFAYAEPGNNRMLDFGDGQTVINSDTLFFFGSDHEYESEGVYNVCLTVDDQSETAYCEEVIVCGSTTPNEEIQNVAIVEVYPNPSSEFVRFNIKNSQQARFILFDLNGGIHRNEIINDSHKLDVSILKSGVYYYSINTEHGQKSGSLIKL